MPGARRLTVVLFAAAWMVSACVSVGAPAQTGSPVAQPTDLSAQPTESQPSIVEPTLEPEPAATTPPTETEPPTAEPTEPGETTPTDPPTTTEPPAPGPQPNLRVLKFEVVREPVTVGDAAALTADIINYTDTAAGGFNVQFVVAQPGQEEVILESQTIERLAAGAATTLTVSVTPDVAGKLTLIARVDPSDQVSESDESDNETVLEIDVAQNETNLTLPADGLTVLPGSEGPGTKAYLFTIAVTNTGQSTLVGPMRVKYFGYTAAGDYVEWGTFDFDINLAPGAPLNQQVAWPVDPGTYRAYALADSDNAWAETDEEDNEAFFDLTAP